MNMRKGACVICGLALAGALATGCMPASSQAGSSAASSATPASAYITSVHQAFSTIDVQMEDVKKAAAAADTTAVYAALDKVDAQVRIGSMGEQMLPMQPRNSPLFRPITKKASKPCVLPTKLPKAFNMFC